jgi:large subunit ribosomal protein L35
MPKMKTNSSAKKRFSLTATGKVKRAHAFKNHILTKKSKKRKEALAKTGYIHETNEAAVKRMMPYA